MSQILKHSWFRMPAVSRDEAESMYAKLVEWDACTAHPMLTELEMASCAVPPRVFLKAAMDMLTVAERNVSEPLVGRAIYLLIRCYERLYGPLVKEHTDE